MQKSLKKSLYLGLAALSFASVAGATNANAAKKHNSKKTVKTVKKAKPVTYTSSYNLDQSVVYSLNGNNAIYTKPGTVKGARVVASKSDVKSVANSSKGYFMAYGEAKTSKGVHYYKVVSFDHKYRGWVYAGSAKKVDSTTTSTDTPKNNVVYLKNNVSNTLWDAPKYSAFKTSKVANNNAAIANDQYVVDKAVKLNREGWTYYHVTNKTNANYAGWVWAGATSDAKPTDNFNAAKDIKVNFVYNGSTVKSSVFHAYDMSLRTNNSAYYDQDALANALTSKDALANYNGNQTKTYNWLETQLRAAGYTVADQTDNGFNAKSVNLSKLANVKPGDTVWLDVNKTSDVNSKFSPRVLNSNVIAGTSTSLTEGQYYKPFLSTDDANLFNGKPSDKQWTKLGKLFDSKSATPANIGQNNTLAYLMGRDASTYLDASAQKTVYNSDAAAAAAYQDALSHSFTGAASFKKADKVTYNNMDDESYYVDGNGNYKAVSAADPMSASQFTNMYLVKFSGGSASDGKPVYVVLSKDDTAKNNASKVSDLDNGGYSVKAIVSNDSTVSNLQGIKKASNGNNSVSNQGFSAKYGSRLSDKAEKITDTSAKQFVDGKATQSFAGLNFVKVNGVNDNNKVKALVLDSSNNKVIAEFYNNDYSDVGKAASANVFKPAVKTGLTVDQYLSQTGDDVKVGNNLKDFAGLSSEKNNPFGYYGTNSDYTKLAQGGYGQQIHYVYFVAPETEKEMKDVNMSNGSVTAYYYAVPVAGPANSHQANGTDKY
ncbi:hypothetical protein [Apilactobacillus xinyiensis]|uniref:hypothetical protein n=1 Tax=Apilactobacillus xinyiensis TaxID=2841032 RepID=UPI001C7CF5B6|nr:hypothetical protein [Apilactobacillus xinyiensis]